MTDREYRELLAELARREAKSRAERDRELKEHRDKRLFGILACVDAPENLERSVLQSGIYLAKIHDETFRIQVPDSFVPRSYQN